MIEVTSPRGDTRGVGCKSLPHWILERRFGLKNAASISESATRSRTREPWQVQSPSRVGMSTIARFPAMSVGIHLQVEPAEIDEDHDVDHVQSVADASVECQQARAAILNLWDCAPPWKQSRRAPRRQSQSPTPNREMLCRRQLSRPPTIPKTKLARPTPSHARRRIRTV